MKILAILVSIAAVFAMAVPTLAYADPAHCDRTGYPSCWDLGRAAGQAAGSGPCPNGDCCFNYIIGLPQKDSVDKPLYHYEQIMFDPLLLKMVMNMSG
jgi:hypothetical protein